jgi:putative flavoprotein involved in K+ transport
MGVFDQRGKPRHQGGISEYPGLCSLDLPWLSARKSGILLGASDDAARILQHLRLGGLSNRAS